MAYTNYNDVCMIIKYIMFSKLKIYEGFFFFHKEKSLHYTFLKLGFLEKNY